VNDMAGGGVWLLTDPPDWLTAFPAGVPPTGSRRSRSVRSYLTGYKPGGQ
jgi:hypothetical protein